tara:strand:+ start:196 stop:348 length:153 start_codon:yes stop_codon:yes gene_type:complete
MLVHSGQTDAVSWFSEDFENGFTSLAVLSGSQTNSFRIEFLHFQKTKKGN